MFRKPTFVIIVIVFAVGLLTLGLAGWFKPVSTKAGNPCVNNLRIIEECKTQWALEKNKTTNDTPNWDDIRPYFPDRWSNSIPVCPEGGTYTIGRVGEPPTCSIGGSRHSLPQ